MHKSTEFLTEIFDSFHIKLKEKHDEIIKDHIKAVSYISSDYIPFYGKIEYECGDDIARILAKYDKYIINVFHIHGTNNNRFHLHGFPSGKFHMKHTIIIDNAFNLYIIRTHDNFNPVYPSYTMPCETYQIIINNNLVYSVNSYPPGYYDKTCVLSDSDINLFSLSNRLIDSIKRLYLPFNIYNETFDTMTHNSNRANSDVMHGILASVEPLQKEFIQINDYIRDKNMLVTELQSKTTAAELLQYQIATLPAKIKHIKKRNKAKVIKLRECYELEITQLNTINANKITDVKTAHELASSRMCEIIRLNDKIKAIKTAINNVNNL